MAPVPRLHEPILERRPAQFQRRMPQGGPSPTGSPSPAPSSASVEGLANHPPASVSALASVTAVLGAAIVAFAVYKVVLWRRRRRAKPAPSSLFDIDADSGSVKVKPLWLAKHGLSLDSPTTATSMNDPSKVVVLPTAPPTPHVLDWRPPTLTPWAHTTVPIDIMPPYIPALPTPFAPAVTKQGKANFPPPTRSLRNSIEKTDPVSSYTPPLPPVERWSPPPQYNNDGCPRAPNRSESPAPSFSSTSSNSRAGTGTRFFRQPPTSAKGTPPPPPPPGLPSQRQSSIPHNASGERVSAPGIQYVTAIATFERRLEDELALTLGETLTLMHEYADGWCLVARMNKEQGVVPRFCVLDLAEESERIPKGRTQSGSSSRSRFSSWMSAKPELERVPSRSSPTPVSQRPLRLPIGPSSSFKSIKRGTTSSRRLESPVPVQAQDRTSRPPPAPRRSRFPSMVKYLHMRSFSDQSPMTSLPKAADRTATVLITPSKHQRMHSF